MCLLMVLRFASVSTCVAVGTFPYQTVCLSPLSSSCSFFALLSTIGLCGCCFFVCSWIKSHFLLFTLLISASGIWSLFPTKPWRGFVYLKHKSPSSFTFWFLGLVSKTECSLINLMDLIASMYLYVVYVVLLKVDSCCRSSGASYSV